LYFGYGFSLFVRHYISGGLTPNFIVVAAIHTAVVLAFMGLPLTIWFVPPEALCNIFSYSA
jgi:hypothetical protein